MAGFNQDIEFILGGLANGMDVNTAFSMYQQLMADRQSSQANKGQALSDLISQGVTMGMQEDADPAQVLQAVTALGQGMGLGPKKLGAAVSTLTGTEEQPGLLGGAMTTGWDDEDDAGFFNTEEGSPMHYMQALFTNPRLQDAGGLPDRAAIRNEMKVRFGVMPEELPGFNAAVDRGYQSLLNTSSSITPEMYETYEGRLNNAGRTSGGAGAPEDEAPGGLASVLGLPVGAAGLYGVGAYGKQGANYLGSKLPGKLGERYAAKFAKKPLLSRGISALLNRGATEAAEGGATSGLSSLLSKAPGGLAQVGSKALGGALTGEAALDVGNTVLDQMQQQGGLLSNIAGSVRAPVTPLGLGLAGQQFIEDQFVAPLNRAVDIPDWVPFVGS